jgi:hypothetical protein
VPFLQPEVGSGESSRSLSKNDKEETAGELDEEGHIVKRRKMEDEVS